MKIRYLFLLFIYFFTFYYIKANAQGAYKTTGVTARLQSVARYHPGGGLTDTTLYIYSNNRSGNVKFLPQPITSPNNSDVLWLYSGNYDTAYSGRITRPNVSPFFSRLIQSFDANNNILTQLEQSRRGSSWTNSNLITNTYDAQNNLLKNSRQGWDVVNGIWYNAQVDAYVYDANNNRIADTFYNATPTSKDYQQLMLYSYDSHNNLTAIQYQNYRGAGNWDSTYKTLYSYNATGQLDSVSGYGFAYGSGPWQEFNKDIYTYYSDNKLLSDTTLTPTAITKIIAVENVYTGNDLSIQLWSQAFGTTTLQPIVKQIYSYDANHNLLNEIIQAWTSDSAKYENYAKIVNVYNSFNKVSSYDLQDWDLTSWVASISTFNHANYHYEFYNNLGLNAIAAPAGDIKLYPNPASSMLTIDAQWNSKQDAIMAIYDMSGKLCRQWYVAGVANYHSTIAVNNLPAGNYILKVNGGDVHLSEQFSVVH